MLGTDEVCVLLPKCFRLKATHVQEKSGLWRRWEGVTVVGRGRRWAVAPQGRTWGGGREQEWLGDQLGAHRVDDKADGLQLGSVRPPPSPVLLHQGHQAGADGFLGLWVIVILLGERELKLGVGPERVCGGNRSGRLCTPPREWPFQPRGCLLNRTRGDLMAPDPCDLPPRPACGVSQWPIPCSLCPESPVPTEVAPAAPRSAAPPPAALVEGGVPTALVVRECVRHQVTDFQEGEVVQEILVGHPVVEGTAPSAARSPPASLPIQGTGGTGCGDRGGPIQAALTRTPRLPSCAASASGSLGTPLPTPWHWRRAVGGEGQGSGGTLFLLQGFPHP